MTYFRRKKTGTKITEREKFNSLSNVKGFPFYVLIFMQMVDKVESTMVLMESWIR